MQTGLLIFVAVAAGAVCAAVIIFFCCFIIIFVRFERFSKKKYTALAKLFVKRYRLMLKKGREWASEQPWQQVSVRAYDGIELKGCRLSKEGSKRTLILFHGYRASSMLDFCCAYEFYSGLGFDILAVDQRAHGDSGGRVICFGTKERNDCKTWADYVCRTTGDDCDVFLGGVSMGGTTVLLAAGSDLPATVRGIIADCAFTSAKDQLEHFFKNRFRVPARPLIGIFDTVLRHVAGFGTEDCSTLEVMKNCKLPVLFIHGAEDRFVPTRMSRENFKACASEKEMLIVPGAAHEEAYIVGTPEYEAAVSDFVKRYSVCGN
ncbi:MAG: alpha/beta hydrolase [Oscillospiraceae bacterium]|nr:alpha/beta hydrolase [Oscillospiraceae bacterium]